MSGQLLSNARVRRRNGDGCREIPELPGCRAAVTCRRTEATLHAAANRSLVCHGGSSGARRREGRDQGEPRAERRVTERVYHHHNRSENPCATGTVPRGTNASGRLVQRLLTAPSTAAAVQSRCRDTTMLAEANRLTDWSEDIDPHRTSQHGCARTKLGHHRKV